MATPLPSVDEAFSGLGSWRPENAQELLEFLDGLPVLISNFGGALGKIFESCQEFNVKVDETGEVVDELTGVLDDAHDKAIDLLQVFKEENSFWLEGDRNV